MNAFEVAVLPPAHTLPDAAREAVTEFLAAREQFEEAVARHAAATSSAARDKADADDRAALADAVAAGRPDPGPTHRHAIEAEAEAAGRLADAWRTVSAERYSVALGELRAVAAECEATARAALDKAELDRNKALDAYVARRLDVQIAAGTVAAWCSLADGGTPSFSGEPGSVSLRGRTASGDRGREGLRLLAEDHAAFRAVVDPPVRQTAPAAEQPAAVVVRA